MDPAIFIIKLNTERYAKMIFLPCKNKPVFWVFFRCTFPPETPGKNGVSVKIQFVYTVCYIQDIIAMRSRDICVAIIWCI